MGARRFAVGFLVGVMVLLSGIGVMLSLRGLERGEAFTMNIQASPPRLRFEYHGRPPDKKTRQTVIFKKTKGRTNDSSIEDRKSTRLNSSHVRISYAVFCLKKKKK